MQLRRYAVVVMDNWTSMRLFFTLKAALRWLPFTAGYLYWWDGESWRHLIVGKAEKLHGR